MERGYEEVSSNQARRQRVIPWEMPIASSLVEAMFVEELSLYSQVPVEISLEMSSGLATSIIGEADNTIYLTPRAVHCRTFALYPASSCTRTLECFSYSNGL